MTYLDFINNPDLDKVLDDINEVAKILYMPWDGNPDQMKWTTSNSIFARIMCDYKIDAEIRNKVFLKMDQFFGKYEVKGYKTSVESYKIFCYCIGCCYRNVNYHNEIYAGIKFRTIPKRVSSMFKERVIYFKTYDDEEDAERQRRNREKRQIRKLQKAGNLELISKLLPRQMAEEEVISLVNETKISINANIKSDFGKMMKEIYPQCKGKFDVNRLKEIINSVLK